MTHVKRRLKDVLQPDLAQVKSIQEQQAAIVQSLESVAANALSYISQSDAAHADMHANEQALALEDTQIWQALHDLQLVSSDESASMAQMQTAMNAVQQHIADNPSISNAEWADLLDDLNTLQTASSGTATLLSSLQARTAAEEAKSTNDAAKIIALEALTSTQATAISSIQSTLLSIQSTLTTLNQRLVALEAKQLWVGTALPLLPMISINGTIEQTVTWQGTAPSADYSVFSAVSNASSLLGNITANVKPGSKTTTGCVIQIKNTGLIALTTGAELSVLAIRYG